MECASCPRWNKHARSKVSSRSCLSRCATRKRTTQVERAGQSQWQHDHWKAKDAQRLVENKGHDSIVLRWQNGEIYRTSQTVHGWTEEYCRYMDYVAFVDISFAATWSERSRYENNLTIGINDGPLPGPTRLRPNFPRAARTRAALRHELGRMNPYILKSLREWQRPIDDKVRSDLEWQSWIVASLFLSVDRLMEIDRLVRATTKRMARSAMVAREVNTVQSL